MTLGTRSYDSVPATTVAFLGLGVMGHPMAGHLVRAGHRVTVYNRTGAKAEAWASEFGGRSAPTPAAAAKDAAIVFCCVGNDDDLRSVALGDDGAFAGMAAGARVVAPAPRGPDGAFAGMAAGAVFVDHTTASAEVARELGAAAAAAGVGFVDAPVSGGNLGALNGALTVMCGGDAATFERVQPVAMAYAKAMTLLGPVGAGQLAKMVNQIAIAGLVQGLSEAIAFGERAGLDMKAVLGVIGKGAAQSWQMDNRGPTMVEGKFDFGFAVDWMRKDLGIALEEARRNGAKLPVTALVDQFYGDVQGLGGRRNDTSSLIRRLRG